MRLVADIGGTNARIGLCADGVVEDSSVRRFNNADWDTLTSVLTAYCADIEGAVITEMVIAVAGPVRMGQASLTNRNWTINAGDLAAAFSVESVTLLNDLTAMGYAVPMLDSTQARIICGKIPAKTPAGQALVVGIGTGFNISQVIMAPHGTLCPPAEAGHVSMPSRITAQLASHGCNIDHFPTVETLFSGRGFTAFCRQMTGLEHLTGEAAIASYGSAPSSEVTKVIDIYASLMGDLLRDLSLLYMPTQGVFLAGSVARAIAKTSPEALAKIVNKECQFRSNHSQAIYSIEDDGAALIGCARFSTAL